MLLFTKAASQAFTANNNKSRDKEEQTVDEEWRNSGGQSEKGPVTGTAGKLT